MFGAEQAPVDLIWCDGLAEVEVVGGTVRFVLFVARRDGDGEMRRWPRLGFMMSLEGVTEGVVMTIKALAGSGTAAKVVGGFLN